MKEGEKYTLDQWSSWPEGERWELIGGVAYNMSPSPQIPHQRMSFHLAFEMRKFMDGKPCEVFIAPMDVFLPDGLEDSTATVVMPDVFVVCDPKKIEDDGIHGAPDFIAEVLSVSTASKDITEKKALYERAGVREYWILNPKNGTVYAYILLKGKYAPVREIRKGEGLESTIFPGFFWKAE